jgi:hypothetical protein
MNHEVVVFEGASESKRVWFDNVVCVTMLKMLQKTRKKT